VNDGLSKAQLVRNTAIVTPARTLGSPSDQTIVRLVVTVSLKSSINKNVRFMCTNVSNEERKNGFSVSVALFSRY